MRVTSALWVAAFVRRCYGEGAPAVVMRRGAEEAGAIFVVVDRLDGNNDLYAPAPQTEFSDTAPSDRLFQRMAEGLGGEAIRAAIERELRFDPDVDALYFTHHPNWDEPGLDVVPEGVVLRARRAGFTCACVGTAVAMHEGSASIGTTSARRIYFATRNHLLLARRSGSARGFAARAAQTVSILGLNLAHVLLTSAIPVTKGLPAFVAGARDHFKGRYGAGHEDG